MKFNRSILLAFVLLILAASLYRIWPGRPFGFAPQWAMAIFAGAMIKDKKWAVIITLLSMIVSDTIYQVLYNNGTSQIWGFYEGMWLNYLLFALMPVFGFIIARKVNFKNVLAASLAAPSAFFLLSNFAVWIGGGGYSRPKTFDGLLLCYSDGVPFYQMSLLATPVFCAILFSVYIMLQQRILEHKHAV